MILQSPITMLLVVVVLLLLLGGGWWGYSNWDTERRAPNRFPHPPGDTSVYPGTSDPASVGLEAYGKPYTDEPQFPRVDQRPHRFGGFYGLLAIGLVLLVLLILYAFGIL